MKRKTNSFLVFWFLALAAPAMAQSIPAGPTGDLQRRVTALETAVSTLNTSVTSLQNSVADLATIVASIGGGSGSEFTGTWSGSFITLAPFQGPMFRMSGNGSSAVNGDFNIITLPIFDPAGFFTESIALNLDQDETLTVVRFPEPITLTFTSTRQLLQGTGVGGSENSPITLDGVVIGDGFVMLRGEFTDESGRTGRFTVSGAVAADDPTRLGLTGSGRDGNGRPFFFRAGLRKQ